MNSRLRNELVTVLGFGAMTLLLLRRKKLAAACGLTAGALLLNRDPRATTFRGRSVVITGGSRGLGLALADELMGEGAHVCLLARDAEELARAERYLLENHPAGTVMTIVCDVTKPDEICQAFEKVGSERDGIDMIINNAGAITVGPFESMTREDFQAQLDLHFFAVYNAVKAVLPYFRQAKGGRIVNVCSMGGKVAVPHMLPYDTSKFALAGFSQGLAAELAGENISVTTVYPSVMRTGSAIQAVFKGDHEKEFDWFAALDMMPGVSMAAEEAASKIIEAARDRRSELILSSLGTLRIAAGAIFPELMNALMMLAARLMPAGTSPVPRTGADSRGDFDRSTWAAPLRRRQDEAQEKWNQRPKTDAEFNMGLPSTQVAFDP